MKQANKVVELFVLKHQMNDLEKDFLLSELMASYACGTESTLMEMLLKDDLDAFKAKILDANEEGAKLKKKLLKDFKDEPSSK